MLKFLKDTTTDFFGKVANIALAYMLAVGWVAIVTTFYKWLYQGEYGGSPFGQFGFAYKHPLLIELFTGVVLAPLFEEALFRKGPLDIIKATNNDKLIIPTILLTSIIFGLVHNGALSVPIQGVGGFLAACLYIKNGYSYISAVTFHAMWNLGLIMNLVHF